MKVKTAVRREFTLTFSQHEGWAIVAALRAWASFSPEAVDREKWREWATMLDKELRDATGSRAWVVSSESPEIEAGLA